MPILQSGARFAARKMPKVITPATHAVLDYAVAGMFLLMGARMWRSHRRAALGSLACGTAAAVNSMLTDYPGGVFRVIDYRTHGKVDAGLAALTAAVPRFLGFDDESEARVFGGTALAETVITGLTDYNYYAEDEEEHPLEAAS
jgi:hypothetical protein